ncbi:PRP3-domain-containing protein [Coniophora puteana RWD-64-598 SS2]|uniref:PRP3-domain-containing protein n=1 Tax=Coniophora puteana (strain RWD-64-598) TaxID=741705 RepID=A0A5M3N5E3_CONPW|nr:PRP3-domain-containing protein [Coniophora puteana RWD-64-598 SS2]EIW86284.1 PRP3-domain-containing protein [Coniophora puteana RWD-64-598 SS2]
MNKRPVDPNGESSVAKKLKSDNTSPNGSSSTSSLSVDEIARKRAEVLAKVAAMKGGPAARLPASASVSAPFTPSTPSPGPGDSHSGSPAPSSGDLARRVAEAQRRVSEAQAKLAVKDNPYMSMPQLSKRNVRKPAEPVQQGAGLKMTAHPLLLDTTPSAPQSKKDRYKPMQPKFASIKANIRNAPTPPPAPTPTPIQEDKANPYAAGSSVAAAKEASGFEGAPKERNARNFRFNPKGKYVSMGNQLRQEQQLEALKARIAENAKRAGLDAEFETLETHIKRAPPPEAEWWDVALLPNKKYEDIELGMAALNIRRDDSPITLYVQHPIPIPAPADKSQLALKPLKLTKQEQKKMRKQRRQAELQDKRDRVRMGLIPPDAPKVRLSNLMRVLTSDAVQDPTRVEARVRREVAMRRHTHEKANAERKLTDDQRREKIEQKRADEEKKGIAAAVFKVKNLSDPAHRFKVRKNAEQLGLTGICLFGPSFALVYVEGATKFLRRYKKLMLNRMAWTEAARPRGGEAEIDEGDASDEDGDASADVPPAADDAKGKAKDEGEGKGEAEDASASLVDNACYMVWEGPVRERAFHQFRPRACGTDAGAKEALGSRLAGYWDMAKNWRPEDEEMY